MQLVTTAASALGPKPALSWHQPFGRGLLTVVDKDSEAEEFPDGIGADTVLAFAYWLAVPVLHAADVEVPEGWPHDIDIPLAQVAVSVAFEPAAAGDLLHYDGELSCPSGRLVIGDPETEHRVDVPPGAVRIQVSLFPERHADAVVLRLLPGTAAAGNADGTRA